MQLIGMLNSPYVRHVAISLVCDNGEVLMDSTLILDYAEALAACENSVQIAS